MTDVSWTQEDAEAVRRYYQAGRCPCCASNIEEWTDQRNVTHKPESIAEGVMLCGRCIGNEHHIRPPEVAQFILRSLAS